jgi:adenylyltransferase/sulfurtransferase
MSTPAPPHPTEPSPPPTMPFREIAPTELAALMAADSAPRLIDIREPHERAICCIAGSDFLPLSEVRAWWPDLDPDEPIVFQCHHGRRSQSLCYALAAQGFTALANLTGGIEAWRVEVEPGMMGY